jgi:ParB family chromosome partitioning protein
MTDTDTNHGTFRDTATDGAPPIASAPGTQAVSGASTDELSCPQSQMNVVYLPLDSLEHDHDPRGECDVDDLVGSIQEVGLLHPITVRQRPDGKYSVLAGNRRVRAHRQLGRATIAAIEFRPESGGHDTERAEIASIHENLQRKDLPPAAAVVETKRLKALYEKLHPETKHGGAKGAEEGSRHDGDSAEPKVPRFTRAVAEATGKSERTVQRDARIGAHAAVETLKALDEGIITKNEAEQLCELDHGEQRVAIERKRAAIEKQPAAPAVARSAKAKESGAKENTGKETRDTKGAHRKAEKAEVLKRCEQAGPFRPVPETDDWDELKQWAEEEYARSLQRGDLRFQPVAFDEAVARRILGEWKKQNDDLDRRTAFLDSYQEQYGSDYFAARFGARRGRQKMAALGRSIEKEKNPWLHCLEWYVNAGVIECIGPEHVLPILGRKLTPEEARRMYGKELTEDEAAVVGTEEETRSLVEPTHDGKERRRGAEEPSEQASDIQRVVDLVQEADVVFDSLEPRDLDDELLVRRLVERTAKLQRTIERRTAQKADSSNTGQAA